MALTTCLTASPTHHTASSILAPPPKLDRKVGKIANSVLDSYVWEVENAPLVVINSEIARLVCEEGADVAPKPLAKRAKLEGEETPLKVYLVGKAKITAIEHNGYNVRLVSDPFGIKTQDPETILSILEESPSLAPESQECSVLITSCCDFYPEGLALIYNHFCKKYSIDHVNGCFTKILKVKQPLPDSITSLKEAGWNPDTLSAYGRTALHEAVLNHHTSQVLWLLSVGASRSIADINGLKPVHYAIIHYQANPSGLTVWESLHDCKDPNPWDTFGTSVLDYAILNDCLEVIKTLSAFYDIPNGKGLKPLSIAFSHQKRTAMDLILERVDVNAPIDSKGRVIFDILKEESTYKDSIYCSASLEGRERLTEMLLYLTDKGCWLPTELVGELGLDITQVLLIANNQAWKRRAAAVAAWVASCPP